MYFKNKYKVFFYYNKVSFIINLIFYYEFNILKLF